VVDNNSTTEALSRRPILAKVLIVKDVFRNTKEKYDDLVMEIACGLHNFRVHHR
jgi:hypothetical protein